MYVQPFNGIYLMVASSCLLTDLIIHPLPFDIQSLILLRFVITIAYNFGNIILISYFPSLSFEVAIVFFPILLHESYI